MGGGLPTDCCDGDPKVTTGDVCVGAAEGEAALPPKPPVEGAAPNGEVGGFSPGEPSGAFDD